MIKGPIVLTPYQREIWMLSALYPQEPLFHIGGVGKLPLDLNIAFFVRAVECIQAEIDVLQRSFQFKTSSEVDLVNPIGQLTCPVLDFSREIDADNYCHQWMQTDMNQPFDHDQGPWFQVKLLRSKRYFYWVVKTHQLVMDLAGIFLCTHRIADIYNGFIENHELEQKSFPEYAGFSERIDHYLVSDALKIDSQYWSSRLDLLQQTELIWPQSGRVLSKKASCHRILFDQGWFQRLKQVSEVHQVSIYALLLSGIFGVLTKLKDSSFLSLGTHVLNRKNYQDRQTVGMCVNTIPLIMPFKEEVSIYEMAGLIQKQLRQDYRHQRMPFSMLDKALEHTTQEGFPYEVMVSYEDQQKPLRLGRFNTTNTALMVPYSLVPVTLFFRQLNPQELCLDVAIQDEVLSRSKQEKLVELFNQMLDSIPDCADQSFASQLDRFPAWESADIRSASYSPLVSSTPEKAVAMVMEIFSEFFPDQAINPQSNFFQLGGDSLQALRLIQLLKEKGWSVNWTGLRQMATPAQLAQCRQSASAEDKMTQNVIGIWANLLRAHHIDLEANFFDLGGDSLMGIRLISELRAIDIDCQWADIATAPVLKDFIKRLRTRQVYQPETGSYSELSRQLAKEFGLKGSFQEIDFPELNERFVLYLTPMAEFPEWIPDILKKIDQFSAPAQRPHYIFRSEQELFRSLESSTEVNLIKKLVDSFHDQEVNFFNRMISQQKESEFNHPVYADGTIFFRQIFRPSYFVEMIRLTGSISREDLVQRLNHVMREQPLLRSVLIEENHQAFWRVFEHAPIEDIPFLDLTDLPPDFSFSFIYEVMEGYFQKPNRLRAFPFRVGLIKLNHRESILGLLMDESIHDKYGADLIRERMIGQPVEGRNDRMNSYEHYLKRLNQGPADITADQIIKDFKLVEYVGSLKKIDRVYKSRMQGQLNRFETILEFPEKGFDQKFVDRIAGLFSESLKLIFGNSPIPVLILHDNRAYDLESFAGTVGEFTDFVPMVWDPAWAEFQLVDEMARVLTTSSRHWINFRQLFFQKSFQKGSFKKVFKTCRSILDRIYKGQPLVFFHYRVHADDSIETLDDSVAQSPLYLKPWFNWFYFQFASGPDGLRVHWSLPIDFSEEDFKQFISRSESKLF